MNKPLWQPSEKLKEESLLRDFCKFINFKSKKLKTDLITYYKPLGFYVKGPFELVINKKINKYFIELCWNISN